VDDFTGGSAHRGARRPSTARSPPPLVRWLQSFGAAFASQCSLPSSSSRHPAEAVVRSGGGPRPGRPPARRAGDCRAGRRSDPGTVRPRAAPAGGNGPRSGARRIAERVLLEVGSLISSLRAEEAGADGWSPPRRAGAAHDRPSSPAWIWPGALRSPAVRGRRATAAAAPGRTAWFEANSSSAHRRRRPVKPWQDRSAMRHLPALAASQRTLRPGSPWAAGHGVELPIVQGPMTRVSDTPAFARAVRPPAR
jgi:hypothetical protein